MLTRAPLNMPSKIQPDTTTKHVKQEQLSPVPFSDWDNGLTLATGPYSPHNMLSDSVTSSPYLEVNEPFAFPDPALHFFSTWDGAVIDGGSASPASSDVSAGLASVSSWLNNSHETTNTTSASSCGHRLTKEPIVDTLRSSSRPATPTDDETVTPPLWWHRSQLNKPTAQATLKASDINRIRCIAIPTPSHPLSPVSSPESDAETQDTQKRGKRKASESSDSDPTPAEKKHQPQRKQAHNMIEKRYRANLNDKIVALRDSIPTFRTAAQGMSLEDDAEEEQGSLGIRKLNKATILSEATSHIHTQKKRIQHLNKENRSLRARLEAFEMLFAAQSQSSTFPQPRIPGMEQQRFTY